MKNGLITAVIIILGVAMAVAQTEQPLWHPSGETVKVPLQLFRSPHALNLPTAETLRRSDLEFEISHRFFPAINQGSNSLWGIDGPINMRMALAYAATSRLIVTAAISNADNCNDFRAKYKLLDINNKSLPAQVGVQAGFAWNTQVFVPGRSKGDSRNFQYYGQLIINTMIKKKFGLGVVPSYVGNSDILSGEKQHTVAIGTYAEYYFNSVVGLLVEWTPIVDGFNRKYNPAAIAIEFNTGGHFFKIMVTNSIWLNPSQYLGGSEYKFTGKELRLGFNITRLFDFRKPQT